jgi:geranylgeranyl pyrophosphate synthase
MLDHGPRPDPATDVDRDVDAALLELSHRVDDSPVAKVVAAHLRSGGDRARARLTRESFAALGLAPHAALGAAACVEALHQASLIHDDLIDRSPLRRGQPSVWATHGEPVAIAAGDHLISLAYASLAQAAPPAPARSLRAVHRAVSRTIRGQCADLALLDGPDLPGTHETGDPFAGYARVAAAKSGPLLSLGPELAARQAGRDAADLAPAGEGLAIGYQIVDDVRDVPEDRAAPGASSNLCLLLEAAGLTRREAVETALIHAERSLRGAARAAMAASGGLGPPTARLCRQKLHEARALSDAL